jgi:hypothetical protein
MTRVKDTRPGSAWGTYEAAQCPSRAGYSTRGPSKVEADHEEFHHIRAFMRLLETLAIPVTLADADGPSLEGKYEDVRKGR